MNLNSRRGRGSEKPAAQTAKNHQQGGNSKKRGIKNSPRKNGKGTRKSGSSDDMNIGGRVSQQGPTDSVKSDAALAAAMQLSMNIGAQGGNEKKQRSGRMNSKGNASHLLNFKYEDRTAASSFSRPSYRYNTVSRSKQESNPQANLRLIIDPRKVRSRAFYGSSTKAPYPTIFFEGF